MFSFFSNGQSDLENRFSEANSDMSLRNMYQRIIWNMQPTNEYLFDQNKGEVRYIVDEKGYEVVIKPKVLGTFNLDDKTFLWSDKNPSIHSELNDKVHAFRNTLPKKYRKNKFKSTTDFNKNLLSLFSFQLNANGFDSKRQGNAIIYYALLEVHIFKNNEEILVLQPKSHITVREEQNSIDLIKEFHNEKLKINKLHNENVIDTDEAFKNIKEVHLQYWLNEDSYFYPALSWPCDFDEKSVLEWKTFSTNDDRLFVMYTTDLGWTTESYAYEINTEAKGKKAIIYEY
ncbi:DUF6882 domain-containing protein [Psychroserpens algicola]|uniref:Uncharacterized protein n=1 Tax=Psychroserpens algicola TaxID=1719034 RepID=A0ABT0HCX1_9FLAO|nr:DUF6882 domain-containing protein [Psychroserpens algicola]MCK8481672.1 hypothetical protein [Psychroserpens algicola]